MILEMIRLDIGDDRQFRAEQQERTIALVRLDDEQVPRSGVRVQPRLVQVSPDSKRGIEVACLSSHGQQGGRGRLAMRAGDRDRAFAGDHRRERGGASQHPQPPLLRGHQLEILRVDRGRVDERVGRIQVLERMPDRDVRSECPQCGDGHGLTPFAARHRQAPRQHDPREPAHAGTSDTHDVYPTQFISRRDHLGGCRGHQGRARRCPIGRSVIAGLGTMRGVQHVRGLRRAVHEQPPECGGRGRCRHPARPPALPRWSWPRGGPDRSAPQ